MTALQLAGRGVEKNPDDSAVRSNDADLVDERRAIPAKARSERLAFSALSRHSHASKWISEFQQLDFFPSLGRGEAGALRFGFLRVRSKRKERSREKRSHDASTL